MSAPLPHRLTTLACLALALIWPAWGADTEIYTKTDAQTPAVPNVLLLLEVSEPMRTQGVRRRPGPSNPITLEESLLSQAIDNAENFINYYERNNIPIRIGLMRYWEDHGRILVPVANLNPAQKSRLMGVLGEMESAKLSGYGGDVGRNRCQMDARDIPFDPEACPTGVTRERLLTAERQASNVGALYESWKYFQGGTATGNQGIGGFNRNRQYESPIEYECQKNHVVVFTDGNPENSPASYPLTRPSDLPRCTRADCLIKMTEYMREMDARINIEGNQHVETHFVQLRPNNSRQESRLEMASQSSGGLFAESRPNSFTEADGQAGIDFINHVATPFVAPVPQQIGSQVVTRSYTTNDEGELVINHHIYYGLFEPTENKRWLGNIKKYGLKTDSNGNIIGILDRDGEVAVEDGKFKIGATSYWRLGNEPDGDKAKEGGAGDRLTRYSLGQHRANDREVYIWDAATQTGSKSPLARILPQNTRDGKSFRTANRSLVLETEGGVGNKYIWLGTPFGLSVRSCSGQNIPPQNGGTLNWGGLALGNWIRGLDVCDEDNDDLTTDGRPIMGSVRHKPVVVPFGGTIGDVMVALSNDGYLHILKINDSEVPSVLGSNPIDALEWASIFPGTQLLANGGLDQTYSSFQNSHGQPLPLLDGDISVSFDERNDTAVAYFGQRRGGKNLFAIGFGDPSNFDNKPPLLYWQIQGGLTGTAFEHMGETWSTPQYTTISGLSSNVILFGGGYDPDEFDCKTFMPSNGKVCTDESRPLSSTGNAIYMVNADTGELLWWTTSNATNADLLLTEMTYSFAAPLRFVDTTFDGKTDTIFALDVGGQLWRFDIAPSTSLSSTLKSRVTGGVIADLHGGASGKMHNRRFYNAPDVAFSRNETEERQLRINVGSGYRAHPLDTGTQDRLYSLIQPFAKSSSYTKTTANDLVDITDLDNTFTASELRNLTNNGWYLNLNAVKGEKVLSDPATIHGTVYFTTYTPPEEVAAPCNPPNFGTNRLYVIDSDSGNPVLNLNQDGDASGDADADLDASDRSIELDNTGIAPTPDLVFSANGTQIITGTQILDDTHTAPIPNRQVLYWAQDER